MKEARPSLSRTRDTLRVQHVPHVRIVDVFVARPTNQLEEAVQRQVTDQRVDRLDHTDLEAQAGPRRNVDLTRRGDPVLDHVHDIKHHRQHIATECPPPGGMRTSHVDQ